MPAVVRRLPAGCEPSADRGVPSRPVVAGAPLALRSPAARDRSGQPARQGRPAHGPSEFLTLKEAEQDRYRGKSLTTQVTAIVVLSVSVRLGPVTTAVNGTLVYGRRG